MTPEQEQAVEEAARRIREHCELLTSEEGWIAERLRSLVQRVTEPLDTEIRELKGMLRGYGLGPKEPSIGTWNRIMNE